MNFKKDKLYYIKFLDHFINGDNEMVCETVGWVLSQNTKSVTIATWRNVTDDKETFENNLEKTTIIKSCILKKRVLNF
jgi:hypothetical protein